MQGEQITTRREILEGLGMRNIEVVPRVQALEVGIDLTRRALVSDNWFDKAGCSEGIKCLDNYQYEWDAKLSRWKSDPLHNWASHGSDAWRQFAQGYKPTGESSDALAAFKSRKRNWR